MRTLPQKRDNVAGAFAIIGDITGKRVLLVDDLFDSGATLEETTRLLLQHRAARVNVLTLTAPFIQTHDTFYRFPRITFALLPTWIGR